MNIAVIAVTDRGRGIAKRIQKEIAGARAYFPGGGRLSLLIRRLFGEYQGIVFCMAAGIAARGIAPCLKNKYSDPAVVAVDDAGECVLSLLSGHEGGANDLAVRIANVLGAYPVITTASEVNKKIILGIGCRRGVNSPEIAQAIDYALKRIKRPLRSIRYIATIDIKKDEPGLRQACKDLGLTLRIISSQAIKNFAGGYRRSRFVRSKIGVDGVSQPCALVAAMNRGRLILPKVKLGRVTVAGVQL
ncbi:MAG: cobalamin biosynthesis protein [Candidatus Omnitrophota bacterium]